MCRKEYVVRANLVRSKRPRFLNENYSGYAWAAKYSARRYATREEAEKVLAGLYIIADIGSTSIEEVP